MNAETRSAILNRVRKMLALASNEAATDGERDNAMRMAYATLAKHNLTMEQAEKEGSTTEEARERNAVEGTSAAWESHVNAAAAQLFFCEYFRWSSKRSGRRVVNHYYVGRVSNIATAQEMAKWLVASIHKQAIRESNGRGRTWVNSFCVGAAVRLRHRVKEIQAQVNAAAEPGTAVVLASLFQREQTANKALLPSDLRTTHARATINREGYGEGQRYADTVGLNRQLGTTAARRAALTQG